MRTFRKKCVDFHWHFHPECELIYIQKGTGIRHIGRSVMPYAGGDLCLIGGNLPHAFSSHPDERHGAKWTVMHFQPQAWGEQFWRLPQNQRIAELFTQASRGLCFSEGIDDCTTLLHRLEAKPDFAMSTLLELFERLVRVPHRTILNPADFVQEEKIDPRLQGVLSWMDEHFRQGEMTQADAARQVGMSPQAFCRFFKNSTGRSFRRYINELRLADACSSLKNPQISISEAAFGAGFNNLANFNRRFREILGRTPTSYRS